MSELPEAKAFWIHYQCYARDLSPILGIIVSEMVCITDYIGN